MRRHPAGHRCGACSALEGNKLRALGSTALAGHMAEHGFWLTTATAPPPDCVQIHCGGLGGGALGGSAAPTLTPSGASLLA